MKKNVVIVSSKAEKDLRKIPKYLGLKLMKWYQTVELKGLDYVQKISGYNDEALKGQRKNQRSIRLNKAYRAIYEIVEETKKIRIIEIQEVNKHKY